MAHWDDERDARWVQMMTECAKTAEEKELVQLFESTGDIIYWAAFVDSICKSLPQNTATSNAFGTE
jgi:hypothetical protein